MTRRYTGAEARELAAKATPGPWHASDDCSVCAGRELVANAYREPDARLLAAAPDLAESLAAVEAERDALRAAATRVAETQDALASATSRLLAVVEQRTDAEDAICEAVEARAAWTAALAALREAAK